MSSITAKYGKSVYQLEKGLPPNNVVPQLKERVESMKDKVCDSDFRKYTYWMFHQVDHNEMDLFFLETPQCIFSATHDHRFEKPNS